MSLMKEYDIRLDLKKVIECFINEKSFLETLYIVLQNMENTDPTNILKYVKRILPVRKYNNTENFVKTNRNLDVSSECDIFLTPPGNRQKINSTKRTASDSKAQPAKKKQSTPSQAHYILQKLGRFG
ncbi:hypothetical protein GLOIN_2v1774607 [Rhizophagus irregularis DAOM 181602=DAOM 197198]|nr:hypothetical protein GLOIN_2v1774607 [Rhizophagus irregularis DAOM 181602=DAOM 197198]